MKLCPYCGKPMEEELKFCGVCGKPTGDVSSHLCQVSPVAEHSEPELKKKQHSRNCKKCVHMPFLCGALAALVVAAVVIVGLAVSNHNLKSQFH